MKAPKKKSSSGTTSKRAAGHHRHAQHKPKGGKSASKHTTHKSTRSGHTRTKRTLTLNGVNEGHELTEEDVRFGRNAPYSPQEKPRLVLEHYLSSIALPRPPAVVDRTVPSWPMYGNDRIGDCTIAAAGHEIQAWTSFGYQPEATISDAAVLTAYEAVSGYNPATGANDNGAVVQDVLNYWRKTGIGGHKIAGFAQISNLHNLTLAKQAVDLFGSLYLGIQVPQSAIDQFDAGEPWAYTGDWDIQGGHAVPVQRWGTHETGEIGVPTWGKLQRMTRSFFWNYVEEAWVIFTYDWLNGGKTIEGFDVNALAYDFQALTGQPMQ